MDLCICVRMCMCVVVWLAILEKPRPFSRQNAKTRCLCMYIYIYSNVVQTNGRYNIACVIAQPASARNLYYIYHISTHSCLVGWGYSPSYTSPNPVVVCCTMMRGQPKYMKTEFGEFQLLYMCKSHTCSTISVLFFGRESASRHSSMVRYIFLVYLYIYIYVIAIWASVSIR